MIRRLGRSGWNFVLSSSAEAASRILSILAMVLLARHLQPTGFGTYSALLAYYALVLSLGGLGLDRLALRELSSRDASKLGVLGTLLILRAGAAIVLMVLVVVLTFFFKREWLPLVPVAALAMLPASIASTYSAVFQGTERFGPPAAAAVAAALVAAAFTLFGIVSRAPLPFFLWALVLGEIMRVGWLLFASRADPVPLGGFQKAFARRALQESLPYGVLAILGTIYFRIDLVMLEALGSVAATGLYASAYRIMEVLGILPALALGVLFPRFARMLQDDLGRARELYLLATRLLVWLGFVVGAVGIVFARPILELLYTDSYLDAAAPLVWLMIALIFLFAHAANVTVLFAGTELRRVVELSFLTAGFNVVANLLLIPRFGAAGAAAATAGSEFLSWVLFTPLVCRRLGISTSRYVRGIGRPFLKRAELDVVLGRVDDLPPLTMANG
jgi:O-antigen/teichoic acid export membrane protein